MAPSLCSSQMTALRPNIISQGSHFTFPSLGSKDHRVTKPLPRTVSNLKSGFWMSTKLSQLRRWEELKFQNVTVEGGEMQMTFRRFRPSASFPLIVPIIGASIHMHTYGKIQRGTREYYLFGQISLDEYRMTIV